MEKPPVTPHDLWLRVETARDVVLALEYDAILAALKQSNWLVMRAACLLRPDVPVHQSAAWLNGMLKARHADLGALVRKHRSREGYKTGRPKER